jgi:trehalose-phosphatase
MMDALRAAKEIRKRIRRAPQAALFLDFDGTLAPIVRDPAKAALSDDTRLLVEKLAQRMHVFIVTGRALADIRKRAAFKEVEYAGSHGLEWTRGGKTQRGKVSQHALSDIREAFAASRPLSAIQGSLVENKRYSIAFHYRNIKAPEVSIFIRSVKAILWPIVARGRTEILEQKKVIEMRTRGAHKGEFVRAALKRLPKGTLGIYVGDDTTDEDAFKALPDGITIRIGEKRGSAAAYCLRSQGDMDGFLRRLLE